MTQLKTNSLNLGVLDDLESHPDDSETKIVVVKVRDLLKYVISTCQLFEKYLVRKMDFANRLYWR